MLRRRQGRVASRARFCAAVRSADRHSLAIASGRHLGQEDHAETGHGPTVDQHGHRNRSHSRRYAGIAHAVAARLRPADLRPFMASRSAASTSCARRRSRLLAIAPGRDRPRPRRSGRSTRPCRVVARIDVEPGPVAIGGQHDHRSRHCAPSGPTASVSCRIRRRNRGWAIVVSQAL